MGEAEEAPEGSSHGEALELLMSMASSSLACSVSQFPAKWQSIKDKLQQLCCSLNSLCSSIGEHPVLVELSAVRLQQRSDLDILSCKLDAHMKQLKEMASSGVPSPSKAIVAVRPGVEASIGEKTFYLKDLFSRIRIGGTVQRSQALCTIRELMLEDELCAKVVALDINDGIAFLIGFLESTDACIQERLLVLREAAQALRELTENSDNVGRLCTRSSKLISSSFAVLRNLSRVEEVKMFMVEQGVVMELVKLSQKKEEVRKLGAVELLHAMALDDADVREEARNHVEFGKWQLKCFPAYCYFTPIAPFSFKMAIIWTGCCSCLILLRGN
ncbi:hypothetical protein HU200_006008 [Digitaria exilis]|uniref:DUF7032 domain-containing protein n=1 Tax=Digitaria exilis TaxID=1010633 RepID=A0A835FQ31_9POAL|nr:hypothetical protein HU200_006008 [Digitaria exilis]